MTRLFSKRWLAPAPRGEAEICAVHEEEHVPRRAMLKGMLIAATGVASAVGTTVGFAPTAIAAPQCDYDTVRITCVNPVSCISGCVAFGESCCGDRCCQALIPAARVVTYASGKACYKCCRYC